MVSPKLGMIGSKGVIFMYARKAALERCRHADIMACDPDALVDLQEVHIDTNLPVRERMRGFVQQVGNPYLFKVDGLMIRTVFRPDSKSSFSDALCALLSP